MSNTAPFNCLLVPIDFSTVSLKAFDRALRLVGGEEPSVIALHIIDEALIDLISGIGLEGHDPLIEQLRRRTEQQLAELSQTADAGIQITTIVSVGMPFLEIIRKADDFAVDAIVMGKVGRGELSEKLLFGSTAERVLRASSRPVVVFPETAQDDP